MTFTFMIELSNRCEKERDNPWLNEDRRALRLIALVLLVIAVAGAAFVLTRVDSSRDA